MRTQTKTNGKSNKEQQMEQMETNKEQKNEEQLAKQRTKNGEQLKIMNKRAERTEIKGNE